MLFLSILTATAFSFPFGGPGGTGLPNTGAPGQNIDPRIEAIIQSEMTSAECEVGSDLVENAELANIDILETYVPGSDLCVAAEAICHAECWMDEVLECNHRFSLWHPSAGNVNLPGGPQVDGAINVTLYYICLEQARDTSEVNFDCASASCYCN